MCHKQTIVIPEAQVVQDLFANQRLSLLKVQMQMSSMLVVGLRAKHRGEYFAAAIMREAQELGCNFRVISGCRTRTGHGCAV